MHHNYIFRFCPVCGGAFKSARIKVNEPARLVCSGCDFVFYLDPKLVACSIVEIKDKIVLLKRAVEPEKGKWVVPGGYVDRGEKVETATLREIKEECGIDVRIKNLLGVYSYPGWLEVVIVYVAEYQSGELVTGHESMDMKLLSLSDRPWDNLAFRSTKDALRDYVNNIERRTDN